MKKIVWLVGPPGAGKSTFAKSLDAEFSRIVELNQMLYPLTKGTKIKDGLLSAKNKLIQLIRDVEQQPNNQNEASILVVAGLVSKEILYPLLSNEEVWLIIPSYERWERQLLQRPPDKNIYKPYTEDYDHFIYSQKWYHEFTSWQEEGFPMKYIDVPFDETLLGKRYYD